MQQSKLNVVFMGVSGCGKSTIGYAAAQHMNAIFMDGDDLHPIENITKMASGTPLNDTDREPWLQRIGCWLSSQDSHAFIACSALKRSYRDLIRSHAPNTIFIHLHGTRELLESRLSGREHFFPPSLLTSQLGTLEPLEADEAGMSLDIAKDPAALVNEVVNTLTNSVSDR